MRKILLYSFGLIVSFVAIVFYYYEPDRFLVVSTHQEIEKNSPEEIILSDLNQLSKEFSNKQYLENKPLLINLDQLFLGKRFKGEIVSGLHHDFQGYFETKLGDKFQILYSLPNGFYKAVLQTSDGSKKYSSFFPKEWTRKKVLEKIVEAYEHQIEKKETQGGKLIINGSIAEEIIIRLVVDLSSNIVITAYPVLN